jgi:hypothetical protein
LADPFGIAAGFADRDFDLPEERKIARVDARSAVARPARPDTEIVFVTTCHDHEIDG